MDLGVVREKRSALYAHRAGKRVEREAGKMSEDEAQEQADVDAMDQDLVPSDSEYSELEVVGRITEPTDTDAQESRPTSSGKRRTTPGTFNISANSTEDRPDGPLDSDDDYVLETTRPAAAADPSAGWLEDMTASGSRTGTNTNRSTQHTGESPAAHLAASLRQDTDVDWERNQESLNLFFNARLGASSSSRSLPTVPSHQDTPTRPRIRPLHGARRRQ